MLESDFKQIFGRFLQDRRSDAFLERLFRAFCRHKSQTELTFHDLMTNLALLNAGTPLCQAQWTMRLLQNGSNKNKIDHKELALFVSDVFQLVGLEEEKTIDSDRKWMREQSMIIAVQVRVD